MQTPKRVLPVGCKITNIRRGRGIKEGYVYAQLRGPNDELLIAATLNYITKQLESARFE